MTRPNGLVTELDYSPAERLTTMATTTDLGALVQENQLIRDGDGRITSLIDPFGSRDYSYDAKGRLTAADHPPTSGLTDEAYTYDELGNRTSWTDHAASEVVYDAKGRLIQELGPEAWCDSLRPILAPLDAGRAQNSEGQHQEDLRHRGRSGCL